MFRRPSFRSRSQRDPTALNIVPLLDAMVTLIAFLLFSMTFVAIVNVESLIPITDSKSVEEGIKKRPLQLTLTVGKRSVEIWSPFGRIRSTKIQSDAEGKPNFPRIHERLLEIKKQFPRERQIVFMPTRETTYDILVALMDTARLLEPTDPALFVKNAGVETKVSTLFPDVVFGNLLDEG